MAESAHAQDILRRISDGRPLANPDRDMVNRLIRAGYCHVNPVHVPGEVCPYRLTDSGKAAVAAGRFTAPAPLASQEGQEAPAEASAAQEPEPAPEPPAVAATAPAAAKGKGKAKAKPKAAADWAAVGDKVVCPDCAAALADVVKTIKKGVAFIALSAFDNWAQGTPSAVVGMPYRCACGGAWCLRTGGKLKLHTDKGWQGE